MQRRSNILIHVDTLGHTMPTPFRSTPRDQLIARAACLISCMRYYFGSPVELEEVRV